ncbi:MAG TPA: tRNA (N6-threonylcarbamoyladenosine(37)-N6)-methyltransferase TrmO [Acidimicrobiia bacterium]|nr:tRNA (N6-threonylcarbamoyladenosine(37)-N6)-methyltransferase TrmO [Acidimicrobiia bacterium]
MPRPDIVDDNRDVVYELRAVGHVESPLSAAAQAPKQGHEGGPDAWLVFDADYEPAMRDLAAGERAHVLTWLHLADRSVLRVHPRDDETQPIRGVFATRSQDRPNPLGLHTVTILEVDRHRVLVSDLEAVDGTPIVDVKPVLRSD